MTPLALALAWVGLGLVAAVLLPRLHRRRWAWTAPAAGAVLAGLTARTEAWPGPAAAASGGSLVLGRPGAGLLMAAGVALAICLALAPSVDGGEVAACCMVAAACAIALSTTVPLIWGLAVAVAAATMALRWTARAPGRPTLSAARATGTGAAALLGAAAFVPLAANTSVVDTRTALAGGLLAGGVSAQLALIPLGGWAPAVLAAVRGVDVAPWSMLLAPAMLLTAVVLRPDLPDGSRVPFANVLLVLGLLSAVLGGVRAARSPAATRYGRLVIADLALAAAAVGTTQDLGRSGAVVLILTHLCAGALLLHAERRGLRRQRVLVWLAVSGIPPAPAFWGRLLVLQALAATAGIALAVGLCAVAALLAAGVRSLSRAGGEQSSGDLPPAPNAVRLLAWGVALAALGVGFAPEQIVRGIFGAGAA